MDNPRPRRSMKIMHDYPRATDSKTHKLSGSSSSISINALEAHGYAARCACNSAASVSAAWCARRAWHQLWLIAQCIHSYDMLLMMLWPEEMWIRLPLQAARMLDSRLTHHAAWLCFPWKTWSRNASLRDRLLADQVPLSTNHSSLLLRNRYYSYRAVILLNNCYISVEASISLDWTAHN